MGIIITSCFPPDSDCYDSYTSTDKLRSIDPTSVSFNAIKDNTDGLSVCYNRVIDEHINNEDDILVFCHNDCYINDINLVEKIEKYSKQFDIFGVAGATSLNLRSPTIGWHLTDPDHKHGAVMHTNYEQDWMVDFSNGKMLPQPVITIDGVFIVMTHKAFSTIRFDEQFEFDFYDMDLCMSAYINQLSVGVVPIMITHSSIGDGIRKEEYKYTQQKFMKKWDTKL